MTIYLFFVFNYTPISITILYTDYNLILLNLYYYDNYFYNTLYIILYTTYISKLA